MEMTQHALLRWEQRFGNESAKHEFYLARPARKNEKRKIAKLCPNHDEYTRNGFNGIYYMISPKAVWVMSPPEKVVTVLYNILDLQIAKD